MATPVLLKHRQSGLVRTGYFGFSWTSLIFGGFPALFRGDLLVGVVVIVASLALAAPSAGILGFVVHILWAFFYNRYYTQRLLEQGYDFADSEDRVRAAKAALGVS